MSEHMQSDHRPRYTPGVLVTSGSSPLALMNSEALPGSPSRAPGTRAPPFLLHLDGLRLRPPALAAFPVRPGTLIDPRRPPRRVPALASPPPPRSARATSLAFSRSDCPQLPRPQSLLPRSRGRKKLPTTLFAARRTAPLPRQRLARQRSSVLVVIDVDSRLWRRKIFSKDSHLLRRHESATTHLSQAKSSGCALL